MDTTPQNNSTQPISDDQELAQALAGVLPDEPADETVAAPIQTIPGGMQFEETPAPLTPAVPPQEPQENGIDNPADGTDDAAAAMAAPAFQMPPLDNDADASQPAHFEAPAGDLSDIKATALNELLPLMDHVDLPAEDKFDTYLMLIRSTDDSSLIAKAHEAAQNIADEKRKAEALLDVIKEIDYLSHKND